MRYLLFGSMCVLVGTLIGWILRGWITREHFRRSVLKSRPDALTNESLAKSWEKEL